MIAREKEEQYGEHWNQRWLGNLIERIILRWRTRKVAKDDEIGEISREPTYK